jgi:prepilin-type N-terminal cleavage/methylation domain-containing protein
MKIIKKSQLTLIKQSSGFTIIELAVAMVIMGVISAIGISYFSGATADAYIPEAEAVLHSYLIEGLRYDTYKNGFAGVDADPCPLESSPYNVKITTDKWTFDVTTSGAKNITITATGVAANAPELSGKTIKLIYNKDTTPNENIEYNF